MNDSIFSKYHIVKAYKKGGMSQVFLVRHKMLEDLRIIKIISKKETPDLMLMTEPNILKSAEHPSIPKIYDIEETDEKLYIIKEYIEGVTLTKLIETQGALSEAKAKEIMMKLCDAIHYLHNMQPHSIIHKDIKPDNIIITEDNLPVVIDFGISRTYKEANISDTFMYGSPIYTAPEVFLNTQSDKRTDVYCLGLTYYYMLTGRQLNKPPYEVIPPRLLDSSISKCSDEMVLKATKRDLEQRYSSVEEMIQKLSEKKKHINIKPLIFCTLGLIAVAVLAFAITGLFSGEKPQEPAISPESTQDADIENDTSNHITTDDDTSGDSDIFSKSDTNDFTIIYDNGSDFVDQLPISTLDSFHENGSWFVNYKDLSNSIGTFYMKDGSLYFNNDSVVVEFPQPDASSDAEIVSHLFTLPVGEQRIDRDGKIYVPIEKLMNQLNACVYLDDGRQMEVYLIKYVSQMPVYTEAKEHAEQDAEYSSQVSVHSKSDPDEFTIFYDNDGEFIDQFPISTLDSFNENGTWFANYEELGDSMGTFYMKDDILYFDNGAAVVMFTESGSFFGTEVVTDMFTLPLDEQRIDRDGKIYVPIEKLMNQLNECTYLEDGKQMSVHMIRELSQMPVFIKSKLNMNNGSPEEEQFALESDPDDFTIVYRKNNLDIEQYKISQMDSFYENGTWYVYNDAIDGEMFRYGIGGDFYEFNNGVVRISISMVESETTGYITDKYENPVADIYCEYHCIFRDDKMYIPIEFILSRIERADYKDDGRIMEVEHIDYSSIQVLHDRYAEE